MPQRDLARELRAARPVAPGALRERVRLVAAQAPPRRRVTRRRAAAVLVPAVAAAVAAAVLWPRAAPPPAERTAGRLAPSIEHGATGAATASAATPSSAPAPSSRRLQRYDASLELRVRDAAALAAATRRALAVAASLSGYPQSTDVSAVGRGGEAAIVLRIPVGNVERAIRRLSALGTIVAERYRVRDLTAEVRDTDRLIAGLERRLAAARARPQDARTQRLEDALTARVQALQRDRAATVRSARDATVRVQLAVRTPSPPPQPARRGPLHGIGVAFRWLGIGLLYALALGVPPAAVLTGALLAARTLRRRRDESLLSRP